MTILIILLVAIILMSWVLAWGLYKRVQQYEAKLVLAQVTINDLTGVCNRQNDELSEKNTQMLALLKVLPKTKKVSDYLLK